MNNAITIYHNSETKKVWNEEDSDKALRQAFSYIEKAGDEYTAEIIQLGHDHRSVVGQIAFQDGIIVLQDGQGDYWNAQSKAVHFDYFGKLKPAE